MAKGRKKEPCLTPECGGKAKLRGVCPNCYQSLYLLVRAEAKTSAGEVVTWQLLEEQGRVLPPHDKSNSQRPAIRAIASLLATPSETPPTPQPQQ